MDRMTRNGLLTLIAVFMALALTVRLENAALAQISYTDRSQQILIEIGGYSDNLPEGAIEIVPPELDDQGDPIEGTGTYGIYDFPAFSLGHRATVNVSSDGISCIIQNPPNYPAVDPGVLNRPTNNQIGTVFINIGGPSFINAVGPGGVGGAGVIISTTSTEPAIKNGTNDGTSAQVNRLYVVQLEYLIGGNYMVTYGFRYSDEPEGTFHPLSDIPPDPTNPNPDDGGYWWLPAEVRNLEFPPGSGRRLWTDPPGNSASTEVTLTAGYEFRNIPWENPWSSNSPNSAIFDNRALITERWDGTSWSEQILIPRQVAETLNPALRVTGGFILGNLTINEESPRHTGNDRTLIQSAGVAIENTGMLTVNHSRIMGGTAGILHEYARVIDTDDTGIILGYGPTQPGDLILNNTQIGDPGFIEVDLAGAPIITVAVIDPRDKIMSDGVNGRIIAGQGAVMKRNPIGQIVPWHPETGAEAQDTLYNILNMQTVPIGILARAYSTDPDRVEFFDLNSRYEISTEGLISTSYVQNYIELNDNSWIFADAGISFGNTGVSLGEDATLVFIDRTSGIYASEVGITDFYSLLALENGGDGYSGSFNEIHVDGKVLTGAPSRAGIALTFDYNSLTIQERERLSNVYYHDPNDPDRDLSGNVYYYVYDSRLTPEQNAERNARVAEKFIAYNDQPNRIFWLRRDGYGPMQLTVYDNTTQRWTVHPDAQTIRLNTGVYEGTHSFFTAFDIRFGVGIHLTGASLSYESFDETGQFVLTGGDDVYFGPTVRTITVQGNEALVTGGEAAMYFGYATHVGKVTIGENNDVKNLSSVLFDGTTSSVELSAKNFQAFDLMTSAKRGKLLYDPLLAFSNDVNEFHFDNVGVHGDIVSRYNAVIGFDGASAAADPAATATIAGASFLQGYRITSPSRQDPSDPPLVLERSLVLDEMLYDFLAGRTADSPAVGLANLSDSFGYADHPRHFREALARMLHYSNPYTTLDGDGAQYLTGLTAGELLEGYTRDGTLVVFTGGDIFSGNIYGGGIGDSLHSAQIVHLGGGNSQPHHIVNPGFGNIDLLFRDGTTIFNRNVIERVDGANVYQDAGIRVRDVYVEKTGHLLMNDTLFSVNPFSNFVDVNSASYAEGLIIHDVLNEGIISGNGTFMIAERWSNTSNIKYYEGYLINRGVLAPGLPGFIGENQHQAYELERTAYGDMMSNFSNTIVDWDMRGVPGGQFGTINIFGSLRLMDEHTRPVYDPSSSLYNTMETLPAGEYHVTIGNDTIKNVFDKYAVSIANAPSGFVEETRIDGTRIKVYQEIPEGQISREDWQVITAEKLGTHLSWFSPSAMVDSKTGLPLLTQYEQFEYLTDETRRTQLQRKMIEAVLTPDELRLYDSNESQRDMLNQKLLAENNIRFEFTQLDNLLMRFGFSDVVSVHGTIPPYAYSRFDWGTSLSNLGTSSSSILTSTNQTLGITQLGGTIQADRIYDLDENADKKEKQTSYIVVASESFTGSVKQVTSATSDWVFASVDVLPVRMASGQLPAVLTVIDDPNYYYNRVRQGGDSYNARTVARTLDDAMFTNPGLAKSFNFGLNSPEVLNNTLRQVAAPIRANSLVMNVLSPSNHLFNRIGYGVGGLSTGRRGDVVFRNIQSGQLHQPYGQPAVPPPGQQFAAPPTPEQTRGQSPFYRTGGVWGAYTHTNSSMGDNGNVFKLTYNRNGAIVGSEWNLTPSSVIGGVAMFNEGAMQSRSDKVKSYDYTFGLYLVAAPFEQFEVKSFLGGGYQSYKLDRYIRNADVFIGSFNNQHNLFGINEHYDGETQGHSFNYAIEFARPFRVNPNFVIRPAAGFEYQDIYQRGYTERLHGNTPASWSNNGSNVAQGYENTGATSGTYAMSYRSTNFTRFLMRSGFSTESYFARGGVQLRGYYYSRLAGDRYPHSRQSFVSGGQSFNVRGTDHGFYHWQLGAGSHFWLNQERTATLFFDGDWFFTPFNGGYSTLNLSTGVQIGF